MIKYKEIPVEFAEIDFEYSWCTTRNENGGFTSHGPSVTYKGNGIGWCYNNPNQVIENIISLKRPMTYEEEKDFYKASFDIDKKTCQFNLLGLFNDCYCQGSHEMYNGWVSPDFYRMSKNLDDEGWVLIGVAEAPYNWNFEDKCVALVCDTIDGDKFWCHCSAEWVQQMRENMKDKYNELKFQEATSWKNY